MKRIILLFVGLCILFRLSGQTETVTIPDTVYISAGDSLTVLYPRGIVLNVGDTVSVDTWYVSDDSVSWRALRDFEKWFVTGDSICLDTIPAYKYYWAYLNQPATIENIVWTIEAIEYVSLEEPRVWNGQHINKTDILLLTGDCINFYYEFDGLQPDYAVWKLNGDATEMPAMDAGTYSLTGYIVNPKGVQIDSVKSKTFNVAFADPAEKIVFRSWAGSNDGRPKTDTLVVDASVYEYVLDTLVFAVSNPYRYEFVPVIRQFDRNYDFTYKWEYNEFAFVNQTGNVLEFYPIGFHHSGSYRLITYWHNRKFYTPFIRFTAHNTANEAIHGGYIENGVIYDIYGRVVRTGVSGLHTDVIRSVQLPRGIYVLRDKDKSYKFIK